MSFPFRGFGFASFMGSAQAVGTLGYVGPCVSSLRAAHVNAIVLGTPVVPCFLFSCLYSVPHYQGITGEP